MAEKYDFKNERGYVGIGVYGAKFASNVGVLWRTATNFEADFLFTIGGRYQKVRTDTIKAYKHLPFFEYDDFKSMVLPKNSELVAIEIEENAKNLPEFNHPERAIYLLGAEDGGIPPKILEKADHIVQIPSNRCMNVSMCGVCVLYDRYIKKARQ